MPSKTIGISGLAAYIPPYRVNLEDWCDWTGHSWDKIGEVVGNSFRMRGPEHNTYTMAASAVLRLIQQYDIDPGRVRFLALGTESSTDNSAGAVIVRGMVDDGLRALGKTPLARECEVPELKHACLGGTYAMKGAVRYLGHDGSGNLAIVVSADVAEYARGSSGEPTQGAGAVAMLLEEKPRLAVVDLHNSGSASSYRGVDFRKPMVRLCQQLPRHNGQIQDVPVFNGKYSTTCYTDQTLHALGDMFSKRNGINRADYFRHLAAVFMHRPYRRMPESAWSLAYLSALVHTARGGHEELSGYCATAGVDPKSVLRELCSSPDVFGFVRSERLGDEAYPHSMNLLKSFKSSPRYADIIEDKMQLGANLMADLGNLYTAALPAWLAAGLEEATTRNLDLAGMEVLTIGYGSGDAAEAIPFYLCDSWHEAASKIGFQNAMRSPIDLNQTQYESLHDHGELRGTTYEPKTEFVLDRIGIRADHHFTDTGIEYYRFVQ
ncbi:MAG: hydroxymethylglutaryl-CoA synthase [Gammaproteobacteria bacterium]|nr:hydroxymethylglutaryl-CoA synthase [Gammaproteobacteria bacterium]